MELKVFSTWLTILAFYCSVSAYFDQQIQSDLLKKIEQETPQWIIDQIGSDLKHSPLITNDLIDKTFQNYSGNIVRFKIINRKIRAQFSHPFDIRSGFIRYFLEELNNYVELPDIDFLVGLDDAVFSEQCLVPVLGFCRNREEKNVLLIPDYQIFHCLQEKSFLPFVEYNVLHQVFEGIQLYPWTTKISKAIWRGADTGGPYTIDTYHQLPRVQLINLSNKYSEILDAKFNVLHNRDSTIINRFSELNFMGSSLSIRDQIQYKYQILMDGHTASWPGAFWRFHSGCLVLKQDSDFTQWYYSLLKPYENYIPFARNAEDLIEKLKWAIEHDKEVQQIVKNANEMCAKCLTYVDILYYFYVVLKTYAKLQSEV